MGRQKWEHRDGEGGKRKKASGPGKTRIGKQMAKAEDEEKETCLLK